VLRELFLNWSGGNGPRWYTGAESGSGLHHVISWAGEGYGDRGSSHFLKFVDSQGKMICSLRYGYKYGGGVGISNSSGSEIDTTKFSLQNNGYYLLDLQFCVRVRLDGTMDIFDVSGKEKLLSGVERIYCIEADTHASDVRAVIVMVMTDDG